MSSIIKSGQVKAEGKFNFAKRSDNQKKENVTSIKQKQSTSSKIDKSQAEAKNQANQIIQRAEKKAEKILNQAQQEAIAIKQEAEQEAEELIKEKTAQAKEKGYQEGVISGKEIGKKEVINNFKQLLTNLDQNVNSFRNQLHKRLPQLKDDLIKLVIEISKKVIASELNTDKFLIEEIVENSLQFIDGEEEVTIRVRPEDLAELRNYKEELITNNSFEQVKIITDESIEIGGCIIETNFGGVDATVLSQLEEIEIELLEADSDE